MRLPILLLAFLAALGLGGCFSGSGQNPNYQYTQGPSQTQTFTLDWFTASLNNNQSNGNGTVTISWNGTTVQANGFPTVLAIPQNAIVTVTVTPADQFTTWQWNGVTPGTNFDSATFYMRGNMSLGVTFISNAGNG